MSRTKSLLRNAQRLGECNTPDLIQEPSQDLLSKLKKYRAESFSKHSSPLRNISKIQVSSQTPDKYEPVMKNINSSRTWRPCTTPYSDNILTAAKMIEKPYQKHHKLSYDSYYQEKSNERLYRGARVVIGKISLPLNSEKPAENQQTDHVFTEEAETEFIEFLDSIRMLYPLRFDLELNYEVVRSETKPAQHTMLGDYFSLQEKIESLLKTDADSMKNISVSDFLKIFSEYNRIVRHILLGLKIKDQNNEATLLEMLWRIIVKLFDNALILHEQSIFDLNEMMRIKTKNTIKEYSEKMKTAQNNFLVLKKEYEEKIEKIEEQARVLQSNLSIKEKMLAEKDEKLSNLLEISNRDKSCIEMTRILKKLNTYISETEDQQYKQVAALSGISHVMSMAENFDEKEEVFTKETQTDWVLPYNPFPELSSPKLSKNYFYSLYKPNDNFDHNEVLTNLSNTLEECNGEEQYIKQFGEYLIKNYAKPKIFEQLTATAWVLLDPKTVKLKLFAELLGFPQKLSTNFELSLLKIHSCLHSIEPKNSEGLLPLHKVIETLQTILPSNRAQFEKILSKLDFFTHFPIEINKKIWILLARFYFALEKTKKPLKFHLEALDTKKESFSNE